MVELEQIKSILPKMNLERKKKLLKQIIGENDYKFSFDCSFIAKLINISNEEILDEMFIQLYNMGNIFYEYDLNTEANTNIKITPNDDLEKLFETSNPIKTIELNDKSQTKIIVGEKGDIVAEGNSVPGPLGTDDLLQKLKELEDEFRKQGYTEEKIAEIKYIDQAESIEQLINNLEIEKSYWNE